MIPLLKKIHPHILILSGLFLLQFSFISPLGEFALNDDWVHTEILKHWVESGEFRMNPFSGPSFYIPIVYGAALVKLFGFSFSLLRISTLVISLLTLILFYSFTKEITKKPQLSFWTTLVLWSNPIFYNLTFTFMTDIPALFLILASLYSYYIGFTKKNPWWLLLGSTLSMIGTFTRQTNILTLGAAGLFSLTQLKYIRFRDLLWSFGIPLFIGIGTYVGLYIHKLLPEGLDVHYVYSAKEIAKNALWWVFYTTMYLGFFGLPLCVAWFFKHLRIWKYKSLLVFSGGLSALALVFRFTYEIQFPYILNIVNYFSIGPLRQVINGDLLPFIPSYAWGILTICCALSAGWVLYQFQHYGKARLQEKKLLPVDMLYIFAGLFLLVILIFSGFDRYLLSLFIVATIGLLHNVSIHDISKPILATMILGFFVVSISQTSFYLNWNNARWELANKTITEHNLEYHQLDAGYEWDGFYAYWSGYAAQQSGIPHGAWNGPWWIRNLFVNNTQDYIVATSPIEPYEVIETVHVKGFNPNNILYLLKKPAELYDDTPQ